MTNLTNIQEIFPLITLAQILAYLANRGWRVTSGEGVDKITFELDAGDGDSPSHLWLWGSETHAKFRSRVPNVVFTLAVVEGREAMAIAQEMLRLKSTPVLPGVNAASAPSETHSRADRSSTSEQGLWIVNGRGCEMRIVVPGLSDALPLASGERVWLSGTATAPEVTIDDAGLVVHGGATGAWRAYFVSQGDRARMFASWRAAIAAAYRADDEARRAAEDRIEDCTVLARQCEFVVTPQLARDAGGIGAVCRQAAVLAATWHQVLATARQSDARETVRAIAGAAAWDTALFVLGRARVALRWTPTAYDELFDALEADEGNAPERTAAWLVHRALRPVADA